MSCTKDKYFLKTIGCQMNTFDSSIYEHILQQYGCSECSSLNEASIIIINTCAVRDKSVQKAASLIGQVAVLKKQNPDILLCVVGCASELLHSKASQRKTIDFVYGALNSTSLPDAFFTFLGKKGFSHQVPENFIQQSSCRNKKTAYVPVIFGCNSFCTYCIVPYVRGREKSRPFPEIRDEIQHALNNQATEIVLLGQNVNCYGKDFSPRQTFPSLLNEVAKMKNILRLDFLTSHPREFNVDLLEVIKKHPSIVRRFHFPIQNGDNDILSRMKRGYTVEEYLEKISWIRDYFPDASITTDIIVGFPGETEQAFQNTLRVLEKARFDSVYGAVYSPRPYTKAASFPNQLTLKEGKRRLNQLLSVQKSITKENLNRFVNTTRKVYVIDSSTPDLFLGKTWEDRLIRFKPLDNPSIGIGSVVSVEVTSNSDFLLFGKQV